MLRSKVKVITISSGYDVVPKEKTQLAWKKKQKKKTTNAKPSEHGWPTGSS